VALIVLMENDENVPTAFAGYASYVPSFIVPVLLLLRPRFDLVVD